MIKPLTNPVLMKELRQRMRGNRAMIILTIYLSLIGIVTLLVYLAVVSSMSFGTSNFEIGRTIGRSIFITVMTMALAQVCIIAPALTAGSVAGERERQSYDLLVTTLLSPWQIIVGKLAAALAFTLLLIVAVLPLAALSFLFGGVSGIELAIGLAGIVAAALLYAAVGLLWSTMMRGTQSAIVLSQGTILLWLLGVPFLLVVFGAITFEHDFIRDLMDMPAFVYLFGAVLCSHPFIALAITQVQLLEGESPWYIMFDVNGGGQDVLAPSPWLAFVGISLVLTVGLLLLSARRIGRAEGARLRRSEPTIPPPAHEQDGE